MKLGKYTDRILRNAQAILDKKKEGSVESLKEYARTMKLSYCELSRKLSKKRSQPGQQRNKGDP